MNNDDGSRTSLSPGIASTQPAQQPSVPVLELQEELKAIDVDKAAVVFHEYQRFQQLCLTPDDWVDIQGKRYPKKSALRKWGLACNVSTEIVREHRVPALGLDEGGNLYWKITARAYLRNGRSTVGTAIASKDERKSWGSRMEHDIYSLACTRAVNRSIADLIAGGAVSYEELLTELVETASNTASQDVSTHEMESKLGQAQTASSWNVSLSKEPQAGMVQYPLFYKDRTVGIYNIDAERSELAFLPDREILAETAPIQSFLANRVLQQMKEKHKPDFDYALDVVDGKIRAVLVRTKLDDGRVQELANAVGWAFAKSAENPS